MATLTVRGLGNEFVRKLRIRAAEHGRSAESEHPVNHPDPRITNVLLPLDEWARRASVP